MGLLTSFLFSKTGRVLAVLLAVISAVFLLIQYGRLEERSDHQIEKLQDYSKTQERINDVESSPSRDAAIERLRDNGLIR